MEDFYAVINLLISCFIHVTCYNMLFVWCYCGCHDVFIANCEVQKFIFQLCWRDYFHFY